MGLAVCLSEVCYAESRRFAAGSQNALILLLVCRRYSEKDSCLPTSFPACRGLSYHPLPRLIVQTASVSSPCGPDDSPAPRCILHFMYVSNLKRSTIIDCLPFGRVAFLLHLCKYAFSLVINTVRTCWHLSITVYLLFPAHITSLGPMSMPCLDLCQNVNTHSCYSPPLRIIALVMAAVLVLPISLDVIEIEICNDWLIINSITTKILRRWIGQRG